ncbi:MAG: NADP-dependent isocitrate dehydrogenase [Deltaproteobacteria bacterium]|nr:NADP-dependent isocitrate dehydrogenase [Deltaproteobacteria bacterium]
MRIQVKGQIAEALGDEMTRVMWDWIVEQLVEPYVDMKRETFDLGLPHRDATGDQVTKDFAEATKRHLVGVKCATITPNADRMTEYKLTKMWKSPNATIRGALDGTIFREPITVANIKPFIPGWTSPIVIGRHAYGEIYAGQEIRIPGAGTAEIVFTPAGGGEPIRKTLHTFDGPGVMMGTFNTDASIRSFAEASVTYALAVGRPLWFAAKDTISQTYHARFRSIFDEVVATRKTELESRKITYSYFLIDDAAARLPKSNGGFVLALMNFDGDVWSDLVASAFGSLGLMTSVLVSPSGAMEFEAAHGTVTAHYRKHQRGETTSTNSVASIFAWSGALRQRGKLDGNTELSSFADRLEASTIRAIIEGAMTADLVPLAATKPERSLSTLEFIQAVASRLQA